MTVRTGFEIASRVTGQQLLGAQHQEPLGDQAKGGLLFNLAIRQTVGKLPNYHFDHQPGVPGSRPQSA
jgi:hypothetical protein